MCHWTYVYNELRKYYYAAIELAKYGKLNLNYNYIKIKIIFKELNKTKILYAGKTTIIYK